MVFLFWYCIFPLITYLVAASIVTIIWRNREHPKVKPKLEAFQDFCAKVEPSKKTKETLVVIILILAALMFGGSGDD